MVVLLLRPFAVTGAPESLLSRSYVSHRDHFTGRLTAAYDSCGDGSMLLSNCVALSVTVMGCLHDEANMKQT